MKNVEKKLLTSSIVSSIQLFVYSQCEVTDHFMFLTM